MKSVSVKKIADDIDASTHHDFSRSQPEVGIVLVPGFLYTSCSRLYSYVEEVDGWEGLITHQVASANT